MSKNEISKGILRSVLIITGTLLGIFLLYEVKVLVGYVLIAGIISLIGRPIVVFLNNRLKLKNTTASIFTIFFFLTIIVGITTVGTGIITGIMDHGITEDITSQDIKIEVEVHHK